jgi:hypothetical protein
MRFLSIWQETPELNDILEVGEWSATTSSAALGLAIALGVANPTLGVAAAGLAFASPLKQLIEVVASRKDKKLTLEEVVTLAAPLAYIKSLDYWIKQNKILANKISQEQNYRNNEIHTSIQQFTLTRDLAINVLRSFNTSELGQAFNQILLSQLQEKYKLNSVEAEITVTWVAWEAKKYLKKVIEEIKTSQNVQVNDINSIDIYTRANEGDEESPYRSIEKYLNEQIATAPEEKVFNENFSLKSIYVPLKIKPVDFDGQIIESSIPEKIEDWAESLLLNSESDKAKQVIFIQAGPGRGKSVFCRIFANWVKQSLHPFWIPILIRLRDIESFNTTFREILQEALKTRLINDQDYLAKSQLRFLFILDGFDELRLEGRARGGIETFIKQVASFQENCNTSKMSHRFIITGRQLALQGIMYLPDNLERVELLAMDNALQEQWLDKWKKLVDQNTTTAETKTAAFRTFLRSSELPREVKEELAREPLLLYLLAAMHRDDKISVEKLSGEDGIENKISIYEQAIDWVLTEQRQPSDQEEIVSLKIQELKQVLIEAGLSVTQSGGEFTKISTIENWLKKSRPPIAEKIKKIRENRGDEVLNNALAAFYLKPQDENDEDGTVEFFHTSFGEFHCAKRMQQSIEKWAKWNNDDEDYQIQIDQFEKEIYDVFGYGGLTPEIVEYLFGLLKISPNSTSTLINLFKRLETFYQNWCNGKFINAHGTTFSQTKMRELKEQLPTKQKYLGINNIEIFTVLNVLILLLELHRFSQTSDALRGQLDFHPCGRCKENNELKDSTRLLRIIGLSFCLGIDGFTKTIGSFLSGADLSGADLSGVDLSGANLSKTILRQVHLTEANLSKANLSDSDMCRCDLTGANLHEAVLKNTYLRSADCRNAKFDKANLEGIDLCRAYLYNTDFSNVNFLNASVRNANLGATNFQNADFTNLNWNVDTNWFHSKGLHQIKNPPVELSNNLDYQDGVELSKAYEMIEQGNISNAITKCKEVAKNVTARRGDSTFQAHIYNRFAWLCSLLNENDECRGEIIELADLAVGLNSRNGNYKDTYAIALIFKPNFDMPQCNTESDDPLDRRPNEHPYERAIELLKQALECEDFKKLALPNMAAIIQRRKDWIESLESRINPLNTKMISLLLKEEY